MPLHYIGAPGEQPAPPEPVLRFIRASQKRVDRFRREIGDVRFPGFVSSDPFQVHALLRCAKEACAEPHPRFLEWGSGLGIATCLASLLGCRATGIEIEGQLVEEARKLAADFGIAADFLHGSFVPEGWHTYEGVGGPDIVPADRNAVASAPACAYDGLDSDPGDIDLVYAYPWPDEQPMVLKLFERIAAPDAVIAVYFGTGDHAVYRQTGETERGEPA